MSCDSETATLASECRTSAPAGKQQQTRSLQDLEGVQGNRSTPNQQRPKKTASPEHGSKPYPRQAARRGLARHEL